MTERWSRDKLIWILRTIHCINQGHYEDLNDRQRKTVDLDVHKLIEQYDIIRKDYEVACALIIGAYRVNQVIADALEQLVDAKDHKDTFGKTPVYEEKRVAAWKAARHALRVQRGEIMVDGEEIG